MFSTTEVGKTGQPIWNSGIMTMHAPTFTMDNYRGALLIWWIHELYKYIM